MLEFVYFHHRVPVINQLILSFFSFTNILLLEQHLEWQEEDQEFFQIHNQLIDNVDYISYDKL